MCSIAFVFPTDLAGVFKNSLSLIIAVAKCPIPHRGDTKKHASSQRNVIGTFQTRTRCSVPHREGLTWREDTWDSIHSEGQNTRET